jgi:hypothetical protein
MATMAMVVRGILPIPDSAVRGCHRRHHARACSRGSFDRRTTPGDLLAGRFAAIGSSEHLAAGSAMQRNQRLISGPRFTPAHLLTGSTTPGAFSTTPMRG